MMFPKAFLSSIDSFWKYFLYDFEVIIFHAFDATLLNGHYFSYNRLRKTLEKSSKVMIKWFTGVVLGMLNHITLKSTSFFA